MSIKIGVLGIQGAIEEHISILDKTFSKLEIDGKTISIRNSNQLDNIDGLIIPGGESTTISKFIKKMNISNKIKKLSEKDIPLFGTCAGLVLFAKEINKENKNFDLDLLKLMDIKVKRNAFGSQRQSFEVGLWVSFLNSTYHAIFIRAPVIEKIWGKAKIVAKFRENIVAAEQNNLLVTSFHPELTEDTRIHEYFLKSIY